VSKKIERTPLFNVRTTQMSDEMYEHVLKRLEKHGTFREYAFHLIHTDMLQEEQNQINKEKDKHVADALADLKWEMANQFRHLNRKIEQNTLNGYSHVHNSIENKEEKSGIKEGQLVKNVLPTGEIDEDYDIDF
jgi:hypothetical protein